MSQTRVRDSREEQQQQSCCISVVVPTYKRHALLNRCLEALLAQDIDSETYEILVVDDANDEKTRQLVAEWTKRAEACHHTVRYLPVIGEHGPAIARNLGWRAASSDIIAFTDDDCIPAPGWLKNALEAFTDEVDGISGKIIVPLERIPTDYEKNAAHLETSEFVTANCFYRRSVLDATGGFDERFTAAWREDSDLFFRLLRQQARLLYAPQAAVIHPIRPAKWGISLSQQRKSMFNALLYKKHPDLYWQKVQPSPPWHYYAIVGMLLLCICGILWKSRVLITFSVCVWLLLTGRFCHQRLRDTSHAPEHVLEMLVTSAAIPPVAIFWRLVGAWKYRVWFL